MHVSLLLLVAPQPQAWLAALQTPQIVRPRSGNAAMLRLASSPLAAEGRQTAAKALLPSPELLRSKRPLGARAITTQARSWMQREMRWLAQQYLYFIEHETMGLISDVSEEARLVQSLRDRFAMAALLAHLRRRLEEAPPASQPARTGAEIAARHTPTVWAAFQLGVQTMLQQRTAERHRNWPPQVMSARQVSSNGGSGGSNASWRDEIEWTLVSQLRFPGELMANASTSEAGTPRAVQVAAAQSTAGDGKGRRTSGSATTGSKPKGRGAKGLGAKPSPTEASVRGISTGGAPATPEKAQARWSVEEGGEEGSGRSGTGAVGRRAPAPNRKQPLGRKEVGVGTLRWLGGATERCAVEYVALYDQLSGASGCDLRRPPRAPERPVPHAPWRSPTTSASP